MERLIAYPTLLITGAIVGTITGLGFWWTIALDVALGLAYEAIRAKAILALVVGLKKAIAAALVGGPLYPLMVVLAPTPAAAIAAGLVLLAAAAVVTVFLVRQRRIPLQRRRIPTVGVIAASVGVVAAGMTMSAPPITTYHLYAYIATALFTAAAFADQQWGHTARAALRRRLTPRRRPSRRAVYTASL